MREIFAILQQEEAKKKPQTYTKDEVRSMLLNIKEGSDTLDASLEKVG